MTDEERGAYIKALIEEKAACERGHKTGRVQDIEKELRRLGALAEPKIERAQKRPAAPRAVKR